MEKRPEGHHRTTAAARLEPWRNSQIDAMDERSQTEDQNEAKPQRKEEAAR